MPDGPRYEDDFYAWTQYQARVLREMPAADNRFDREHVAEEIEDLGKGERNAVRSEVRRILEHFVKLAYSPATDPRNGWLVSVVNARAELDERITVTLRRDIQNELPRLYRLARRQAELSLREYAEEGIPSGIPAECPYTVEQILHEDWYPEGLGEKK
jgi:hypothetical protein